MSHVKLVDRPSAEQTLAANIKALQDAVKSQQTTISQIVNAMKELSDWCRDHDKALAALQEAIKPAPEPVPEPIVSKDIHDFREATMPTVSKNQLKAALKGLGYLEQGVRQGKGVYMVAPMGEGLFLDDPANPHYITPALHLTPAGEELMLQLYRDGKLPIRLEKKSS